MADVQMTVGLRWKPGDDLATSGLQVLGQLLWSISKVELLAIAEVQCSQYLHRATPTEALEEHSVVSHSTFG